MGFLFNRLWKELTGRERGTSDTTGINYGRVPGYDVEAQQGHVRDNGLQRELIDVRRHLQDKEQQLIKVEQELKTVERDKAKALKNEADLKAQLRVAEKAKDDALSRYSGTVFAKKMSFNQYIPCRKIMLHLITF